MSEENSLSRVPPEIWERITENVLSSKDLISLCKVVPTCENLMYPKRVEWLFYQVLPVVITNTYGQFEVPVQKDLLNCRRICKHWKFGVDNFLENNVAHYPATGDDVDLKLNRCHFGEILYLNGRGIISQKFTSSKMKKMLNEAVYHPNNPIVGRHAHLTVPNVDNKAGVTLVKKFVESFGRHIYILRLNFDGKTNPIKLMKLLISLLENLPNLKGLFIDRVSWISDFDAKPFCTNYFKEKLNKINACGLFKNGIENILPKLETFDLQIDGLVGQIVSSKIISIFCSDSLKSLTLVNFENSCKNILEFPSLLHVGLHIDSNEQLHNVLNLNFPIVRKLELDVMYDELDYLLYKVLLNYQSSLTHLSMSLHLPDCLETVNKTEQKKMTRFFTTPNMLQMSNIKTISLFGWRPPSFNFICGNNFGSLEYLNMYLENGDEEENPLLEYPLPNVKYEEITDIFHRLTPLWSDCWSLIRPKLYESNVWNVFPKLKCLFVSRIDIWGPLNKNGWAYRRCFYNHSKS